MIINEVTILIVKSALSLNILPEVFIISDDSLIGIGLYYTKAPGTGGIIRQQIDDFVVEELTNRVETGNGKYLIVELTKKNWDTHRLIRELSRILRVSQDR